MGMMQKFYPESRFGGITGVDGTIAFYTRVRALLSAEMDVVDFGCGRGAYSADPVPVRRDLRILRGHARRVIGLDVDDTGTNNPFLDTFACLDGNRWPLADHSVGLVLCDNVLEHLPEPGVFFAEAHRVLVPGGSLCIRTPNAWSYVSIIARLAPNRAHAGILARVKDRIEERDVFPTLYRCNSLPSIRRAFKEHHFQGVVFGYEAEPSYLAFSPVAYALGVFHQRVAPGWLRASIFAFARSTAD